MAILTIDLSFPAIIPDIFVRKTGYSRAARGHSRTVTFWFDALLGLALSHVFYSPILCASVWVSSPIDSFPSMEPREFWPFENICQFLPPTASSQAKATLRPENGFKRLTASSIPTRNPGKSSVPHRLALSTVELVLGTYPRFTSQIAELAHLIFLLQYQAKRKRASNKSRAGDAENPILQMK